MLDFKRFEISHYGFLPVEEPLSRLDDPYFAAWEDVISRISTLVKDKTFHSVISKLPVLDTSKLRKIRELRRAYVILCFFTHAYIWTDDTPHEVLPVNIAKPLLEVAESLDLPPIATYPALNLWNCGLVSDDADITNPDNVIMRHTLTGTKDEEWFYAVSVSVEAKGIIAIQMMTQCVDAIAQGNEDLALQCLKEFGRSILILGKILQRMHEHCDPMVFYHRIRPLLAGTKGMEKAGLPRGVFYEEGDGRGSWRQHSGGSNAQSSLIQFLDIALGVEHHATGQKEASTSARRTTYLGEMRKYMPRSHREFLEHFSTIANVQQHVTSGQASSELIEAYNDAVDALTGFRDIHIRIVARYIVTPSKVPTQSSSVNLATVSSSTVENGGNLKGTGGTDAIQFLKQTRDETKSAKCVSTT